MSRDEGGDRYILNVDWKLGRHQLEDLGLNGGIILKSILKTEG